MSRFQVVAGVDVDRPPAEVFAYLADVARHGEWSPRPWHAEGLTAGAPVSVGTRFTSYGWLPGDKQHRNEVEVTALEAPTRLVLTSTDAGEQFVNTFTVTPRGSGSRVDRTMDSPLPGGFIGLVFPVLRALLIKPDVAKGMRKLGANLEAAHH
jgi:uncharacterized protein YndB with AHSA1/START domain